MFSMFYKNLRKERVDLVDCVIVCGNMYHYMCASLLEDAYCVELKESYGMD